MNRQLLGLFAGCALAVAATPALAAPILCKNPDINHMSIDDSQVSACLDAGTGNLTGEAGDLFLSGVGTGYEPAGKTPDGGFNPFNLDYTQDNGTGTWSFDSSFWDTYAEGAIGFKFGTGNNPDEWFVYALVQDVVAGTWAFINEFGQGGGLSHVNLYGMLGDIPPPPPPPEVPEPGSLGLLGAALLAMGLGRRLRRS